MKGLIEDNNKKLVKKISSRINLTFDKYMGNDYIHQTAGYSNPVLPTNMCQIQNKNDIDSIEDPAKDDNDDVSDNV